ncbi:hypothetical protein WH47_02293 [Habropoda laboriosa]|uniref:Uncharacterized protein n=1 Tax=Habropoda laboriosa TaxID=597456 RepID=A0A0L7QJM5_9HYME|nr:hypothetical protein WH47_02293 [Habropoda laboriosa]
MKIDWCMLKDAEEINALNRVYSSASHCNWLLFVFSYLLTSSILLSQTLVPLTDVNANDLLVRAEYFVDYEDYFYLITTHTVVENLCAFGMQISSDILNTIIMMHISGMFEVTGLSKEDITRLYGFFFSRLFKIFEDCMHSSGVFQICLVTVSITTIMLKALEMMSPTGNLQNKFFTVVFIVSYYILLYIDMIPGEKIIQSSEVLFFKAYCAKWYTTSVKSQKMLLFLMHRFMEPCRLQLKNVLAMGNEMYVVVSVFFTTEISIDLLIDTMPATLMCMLVVLKYATFWVKNDGYNQAFEHMRIDCCGLKDVEEINALRRGYSKASRYSTFLLLSSCLLLFSIVFLHTLSQTTNTITSRNETRANGLIVLTEYFVDYEQYIYPITTHVVVGIFMGFAIQIGSDLLNMIFMMHVSGMFDAIGHRFERLFDNAPGYAATKDALANWNCRFDERQDYCIEYHLRTMKFTKDIQQLGANSYLAQLILSVLAIVALLYRVLRKLVRGANAGTKIAAAGVAEMHGAL